LKTDLGNFCDTGRSPYIWNTCFPNSGKSWHILGTRGEVFIFYRSHFVQKLVLETLTSPRITFYHPWRRGEAKSVHTRSFSLHARKWNAYLLGVGGMISKLRRERQCVAQKRNFQALISVLLLIALSQSCKNENVASPEALRPRLLHDEQEMQAYLEMFPKEQYKVTRILGAGRLYLDDRKDAIKDILRKGAIWEENVVTLLRKYVKSDTTVIDAGAYIGTHTLFMSKYAGKRGRVYAFEPQRKAYRELVFNLKLNHIKNVVPLRFALGSGSEIIEMNPAAQGNEGGTSIGQGGDKAELRTIDSFGFRNVSLIKIDVEGFEDYVIEGAKETIQRYRPILIVEIAGGKDCQKAPLEMKVRLDRIKERIFKLGYSIKQMDRHNFLAKPSDPSHEK
jgi:FkbM family methyltransferase